MECHTSYQGLTTWVQYNEVQKYIMTKRLLKPSLTKYNEMQAKKHDLQDAIKCGSKTSCKAHLGVATALLITYIYIERVSLDTQ